MKAILVKDLLKLDISEMSIREKYPKENGLYLVDDGTMYQLVVIEKDVVTACYPIPRKSIVKEYERIGERDVDLLQKQLSEINYAQKQMQDIIVFQLGVVKEELNNSNNGSSDVSVEALTKMIAVAQKPELLKED